MKFKKLNVLQDVVCHICSDDDVDDKEIELLLRYQEI